MMVFKKNKWMVGCLMLIMAATAWSQTDFQLTVSPSANPVDLPADGGQQMFTYTVVNDAGGVDEGDQTTVTFNFDPQINPISVTSIDQSWDCPSQPGQIVCQYFDIYTAGYSSDLVLTFGSPQGPVFVANAVSAGITNAIGDPNPGNNNVSTDINFVAGGNAELSLQFTSTNGIYEVGDAITYVVEFTNSMASTMDPTDTTVDVTLPIEVSFLNLDLADAPGWNCDHDQAPNGGVINCDRGGAPFTSLSVHDIDVTVVAASPATGAIAQASINSAFDPFTSDNFGSQADTINGSIEDFYIDKTVNGTVFDVGDPIVYSLEVAIAPPIPRANQTSKINSRHAVDVMINDQLPNEVSYVSHNVNVTQGTNIVCTHDGSSNGGLFSCNTNGTPFNDLEFATIDINVTAAAPNAGVINTATVSSVVDPDGTTGDNTSSATPITINGVLPTTLVADKTSNLGGVPVTEVAYGQVFDYVLHVDNTGAADAINTRVTDTLPADVTLVGFDTTGWTCLPLSPNVPNQVVDCTLNGPLAPLATAGLVMNVMATNDISVTSITNTMQAIADNSGAMVSDNSTVNLISAMGTLTLLQNPSPVDFGAAVNFVAEFTNSGTSALTGVQLDSQLPSGFTYNGFTATAGVTCAENQGLVTCTTANPLGSGGSINVNISTTAVANPVTNQTYAIDSTANANELAAAVNQSLNVAFSGSDYSLTMFTTSAIVQQGQVYQQVVTVNNTSNSDIANINAIYFIPQQATLVGFNAPDYSCVASSSLLTCNNLQPLMVGSAYSIELDLRVDNFVGLVGGNVSIDADGNRKTASTSNQIVSNASNDLALSKTASVSEVETNAPFSYLFNVTNMGSSSQSSFSLSDDLPAGMVLQSFNGAGWTCSGGTEIMCQFAGNLTTGGQTQLQMDVISPQEAGPTTNTATIFLAGDENNSNDSSSAAVLVRTGTGGGTPRADLSVVVETDVVEILNTEIIEWRFVVDNNGPDAAANVQITNQFPTGFVVNDVQVGSDVVCTSLQSSLTCDIAVLPANQSHEITVSGGFTAGLNGLLINTVEVTSDAIDPNPANNIGMAQVQVSDADNLVADLQLSLMGTPDPIRQGDAFELAFVAKNFGPDRAANPLVTATIAGLIDNVQVLNAGGWVCQTTNQSLTCQFPSDLPSGMESEIRLNVQTEQVVQQSQPIVFNAMIESDSMDPQPGNNLISFSNDVGRTPTEDEIFAIFRAAVGDGASSTVMQSIRNVSSYCARSFFMAIEGLCEEFIAGARPDNGAAIINAMEELTPNEIAAQSNSAAEIISSQFRNVGSRLAQLRGGGGAGLNVSGLSGRYGNESIPLGMLAYLNQAEDEPAASNINDFVSPWGFFVNGTISMGERDATGRELGFDFDTFGLTAGVDYRFSPTKVAGLALGYANFDSDIEGEAQMESTSITLTGYGSFYLSDNLYMDGRLSYGQPDFDQKRRINFAVDDILIDREASGSTDASQYSVAMSMGYHFNKNAWNITPNASVQYIETTIDPFSETGAGDFNFAFAEQEVKSLVWSVGASISRAISLKKGVISPQFDFNISRETENDGGLLAARFIGAPDDEIFWIGTDEPDRTYGSAGVGLVFIGANGKQAYINYRSIFGLEGFTRGTINIGARFEF